MEIITIIVGLVATFVGVILTKLAENYFEKKKETKLFIADIEDVLRWNWDSKKLLRHLIALDWDTTDNLNEGNEGTPNQWAPVFMNNPDCWKLLALRDAELVGYWSFFALNDDTFEKMKNGEMNDSEITEDKVVEIEKPGTYNIYIVMVCVKEHYRKKGVPLLYQSLIDQLNELTLSNRLISNICLNAFTDEGITLAKNFGLKLNSNHKEFGQIYLGTYADMKTSKFARKKLI